MLPAAGQGALGIEVRSDRTDVAQVLQALLHTPTWLAVSAERAVSRGWQLPMPWRPLPLGEIRATGDPRAALVSPSRGGDRCQTAPAGCGLRAVKTAWRCVGQQE
jgi:hypothetical protein